MLLSISSSFFVPFLSLWAACSPQALGFHPIWRTSCQVHHSEPKERVGYCPNWGSNLWTVDPKSSVLTTLPSQYQLHVLWTQCTYHIFVCTCHRQKKKPLCITIMYLVRLSSDNNNQCAVQICIIKTLITPFPDRRQTGEINKYRCIDCKKHSNFKEICVQCSEWVDNFSKLSFLWYVHASCYNGHRLVTCKNSMWC